MVHEAALVAGSVEAVPAPLLPAQEVGATVAAGLEAAVGTKCTTQSLCKASALYIQPTTQLPHHGTTYNTFSTRYTFSPEPSLSILAYTQKSRPASQK